MCRAGLAEVTAIRAWPADPEAFGIALATTDGRVFATLDGEVPFTIQSMSKPFTFGIALERLSGAAGRRLQLGDAVYESERPS